MIDILIPVFNGALFIQRSVESCLSQKYVSTIIVVDDCSTDDTLKILKSKFGNNSKVLIVERENNGGIVCALNSGLEYVKSEYIARLDSDDMMMPNRLEQQLEFLHFGDFDLVGSDMLSIKDRKSSIKCFGKYSGLIVRRDLYFESIFHPTWLGKKKCFEQLYKVGSPIEDLFFQFQLIDKGFQLGVMNIPTTYYMVEGLDKITHKEKTYHWILASILRLSFALGFENAFETNFDSIKKIFKMNKWLFYFFAPFMVLHFRLSILNNWLKGKMYD
uniref:glycosyltransferase family 2 protein n=1 Tax=Algoriphagus sp. TaxID=1872435 RepID=UPI00404852BE